MCIFVQQYPSCMLVGQFNSIILFSRKHSIFGSWSSVWRCYFVWCVPSQPNSQQPHLDLGNKCPFVGRYGHAVLQLRKIHARWAGHTHEVSVWFFLRYFSRFFLESLKKKITFYFAFCLVLPWF